MFSLHDMTNVITNNAITMSNNARFITTYHLSRDLGGGSHVLGDGSVTLRGGSDAWGGRSKLKGAGSQIRRDPAYFNPAEPSYSPVIISHFDDELEAFDHTGVAHWTR